LLLSAARGVCREVAAPAARAISSARLNSASNASSLQEASPEPRSVVGATRRPVGANSEGGFRAAFFVWAEDPLALVEVPVRLFESDIAP
jgi:hypothetical protein